MRFFVLLALVTQSVLALDPAQPAASYIRKTFTVEDGLPSNVVNAILQTRNGFLWIGTDAGLARFNGRHFTLIDFGLPRSTSQGVVRAMAEGPDGDLWVGTNLGLARIPSTAPDYFGRSQSTFYHPGAAENDEISCLKFTRDGTLWVGTYDGLYRFDGTGFVPVGPRKGIEEMEEAPDGHLLLVASHNFFEWDGARIIEHPGLAAELAGGYDPFYRVSPFLHVMTDRAGVTWYCTNAGVARRTGDSIYRYVPYGVFSAKRAIRTYEDWQGNVWVSKEVGLFRAHAEGLEPLTTGATTRSIFADRDGDLWIGTNGDGLVRFKDRPIRMFTTADGLPNNVPMTVLQRHDGSIWVGNNCGGLSRFDGKRFRTYNEKDGLSNSCVWALAEDANNDLWVGTWGGGLFHFKDGRFTQYSLPQGLRSDTVRSIIAAHDGAVWFATADGLSLMRNGRLRNYTTADGLSSNRVGAVYQDRQRVIWAGTSRGIDRMAGERFVPLSSTHEIFDPRYMSLGEGPFGDLYAFSAPKGISRIEDNRLVDMNTDLDLMSIADFQQRDLWFSGGNGIFRVAAADIGRSWQNRDAPLDYTSFGRADGLNSTQCSIGAPNMTITNDGNLWVATVQGLAMVDVPRLRRTNRKPAIFVEEVTIGKRKQPGGHGLVLSPGTHHLELKFDSIEFASPEKIRFQYRLDGVDGDWLDGDTTRTAVYTSIPLGTHSFHVRACNSDGVWDRAGIVYNVAQQPFFYETNLFRLAAIGFVVLSIAGAYRLRIRQISAGINAGFDERLAERTRLARDLHDTLLQTIQGSKMVADDALDESADPIRMRNALKRLSGWLGQAMQEGRSALNSLRNSTTEGNDLAEALQRAGEECLFQHSIGFGLSVEGAGRKMHPIVRDEVYRIGYEAIRNAGAHSEASQINVELSYVQNLTLRVRDNGKGIDPELAAKGKAGHFGLIGMYERASRVGAKLTVSSSPGAGTEVELVVPRNIVFLRPNPAGRKRFVKARRPF